MTQPRPTFGAAPHAAWFLIAVSLYFAAQIVLRLILGGALETDEAEMMVMTPGLRLGYGPQLPLYNWLQVALFALFGKSLFALSLLKNLLLWLTYVLTFAGLRLFMPAGLAVAGALSLFLLPDVAWEAQRATTHSNMLLVTCAATLAAFFWTLKSGRWAAYVALGLALGLGGLAKYNYWLVPLGLYAAGLSIAALRPRLLCARMAVVPVIAGLVLAAPYGWMLRNPELAFSSTHKLKMAQAAQPSSGLASGLPALFEGMAALAVLPALVALALYLAFRSRAAGAASERAEAAAVRLLWRASALVALVLAAGVVAAGVGHVTPRWLLPLAFLAVPALFVGLFGRLAGRGPLAYYAVLGLLAVAVMTGLCFDRYKQTARRAVDFAPLPGRLQQIADMSHTPVVAEFFVAGNLARSQPEWRVSPYLAFAAPRFGGETVLFLSRQGIPPDLPSGMAQAGWPREASAEVLEQGEVVLGFDSSDKPLPLSYWLVRTPALD